MMARMWKAAAGICAFVLAAGAACNVMATPLPGGTCELNILPSSSSWSISGYNPFSTSPLSATYSVTFSNTGGADCRFRVAFQTQSQPFGLAGAGQTLPYTLVDNTDNVNASPFGGTTPLVLQRGFTLAPGAQQTINYSYIVNLAVLPTDGDFEQDLFIQALDGVQIVNEKPIVLTLNVAPSAVIGLRGAFLAGLHGGAYVDFGPLRPGPQLTLLALYVQSTGGYRVDVESANQGNLRLRGASQWQIPYTMAIGGNPLNLASSQHFDAPRLATARQDLLPMSFTVGDTALKRAGRYEDVITLSVTAE